MKKRQNPLGILPFSLMQQALTAMVLTFPGSGPGGG
jgi:hypothetical protein